MNLSRRIAVLYRHSHQGFSLMELLVVMTIIGLMTYLGMPAFSSIGNAQRITRSAYDLRELLELARTEAVTRQTYVWVGFENDTVSGTAELRAVAVYSRDGTNTNTNSSNLIPLTQVIHIKGITLSSWNDLKSQTQLLYNTTPSSVAANSAGTSFVAGNYQFQGKTVTFTPRGQAMLKASPGNDDGYDELIDVSFRQNQGAIVPANADDAAILVNGSSGTLKIVRLQ